MITVDLIGRTGNQMFQIATCLALALDNNEEWRIPEFAINREEWPRLYKRVPTISMELMSEVPFIWREPTFAYTPIEFKPGGLRLHGYFQCEKYFAHQRAEVIRIFKREWPQERRRVGVVGIHVRRGDYLLYQNKHLSPTVEYLQEAMALFPAYKFLFVSDEIEWCKAFFPGHYYSDSEDTFADMALMASCEHQIISASTFSWWAAWLNENPNKVVVAPKIWFGPKNSHLDEKDIVPESWIRI